MTLLTAALAAQVFAAVSAVLLSQRRAAHAPAAVALVLFAAEGILHRPLLAALRPLPRPITGSALVLVHLDGAASLAQYAIVAGLAVAVAASPERRRIASGAVVVVWLLASVVLGALYPSPLVRGASLQRVYFAADLIGLFVATVALITRFRAIGAAKLSPDAATMIALILAMADGALLIAPFSPWRNVLFGSDFGGVQLFIAILFATITVAQVVLWLNISRT